MEAGENFQVLISDAFALAHTHVSMGCNMGNLIRKMGQQVHDIASKSVLIEAGIASEASEESTQFVRHESAVNSSICSFSCLDEK